MPLYLWDRGGCFGGWRCWRGEAEVSDITSRCRACGHFQLFPPHDKGPGDFARAQRALPADRLAMDRLQLVVVTRWQRTKWSN